MLVELCGLQEDLYSQYDELGGLLCVDCLVFFGWWYLMVVLVVFMQCYLVLQVDFVLIDSMVDLQGVWFGFDVDFVVCIGLFEDMCFVVMVLVLQWCVLCVSVVYFVWCGEFVLFDVFVGYDCFVWYGVLLFGVWCFGECCYVLVQLWFCSNYLEVLFEVVIDGFGFVYLLIWFVVDVLCDGWLCVLLLQYVVVFELVMIYVLCQQVCGSVCMLWFVVFFVMWFVQLVWDVVWV